jgi:hypothetical protein
MPWYYLYEIATGQLISESSRPITDLSPRMAIKEFADRQPAGTMWDPATLNFVPLPVRPPRVDRRDDLQTAEFPLAKAVLDGLTARQLADLRSDLGRLLGPILLREADDPKTL